MATHIPTPTSFCENFNIQSKIPINQQTAHTHMHARNQAKSEGKRSNNNAKHQKEKSSP